MTDAERDELESIIRQGRWMHENPDDIADSIIAAGYRKVPDDCVVVRRDDVEFSAERAYEYADMLESMADPEDDPDEALAIHKRLRQALTDQTAT